MNYGGGYETTSYGGGGGYGGGGWLPAEGSQTSPSGRKDNTDSSLRPITIKQLAEAPVDNDVMVIDNTPVAQVTIVGQIRNIATQTTNITYKLDDGTGSIEVKKWVDAEASEQSDSNLSRLVEGTYCRAWGKLKSFSDRRHLSSQIIRPIDDMNEVQYHLLEATAVHLYFTRGPPGGAAAGGGGAAMNGQAQQPAGNNTSGGYDLSMYSSTAKKVFQYLRNEPQTNEGIHQQEIASNLHINTGDVAQAGDELLAGGLIYTTIDDQTWAVLEAD